MRQRVRQRLCIVSQVRIDYITPKSGQAKNEGGDLAIEESSCYQQDNNNMHIGKLARQTAPAHTVQIQ